jgi:hypothetical protein
MKITDDGRVNPLGFSKFSRSFGQFWIFEYRWIFGFELFLFGLDACNKFHVCLVKGNYLPFLRKEPDPDIMATRCAWYSSDVTG